MGEMGVEEAKLSRVCRGGLIKKMRFGESLDTEQLARQMSVSENR